MVEKKIMVVGIVAFILVAAIFVFFFSPQSFYPSPNSSFSSFDNCENVDRAAYEVSPVVFAELPPLPRCFYSVVKKFHDHSFNDASFFSREYFLQPEFYPNFLEQGLSFWKTPDGERYGVVGFGAFPAEQTISLSPGSSKVIRVFVHSGFGVRSFQGMKLVPSFKTLAQNVSVSLDEESEKGFLLGPSFPVFNENWAKSVDVLVSADASAPTHVVELVIKSSPPSSRDEVEWEQVNSLYYSATQFVGEQTVARVFIKVVK